MWILGIIAASLAITLLGLFIKGGIRLVGAIVGAVLVSIIEAVGMILSGAVIVLGWVVSKAIIAIKLLYRKITTKKTDVSDDANFDWLRDAQLRDE